MKTITLTINTYSKSFAIRMAVKDRIETLEKLVKASLSNEVIDIFRQELKELQDMRDELEECFSISTACDTKYPN